MKWVGQQIYDFISKFRNDVYLEDISSGTIASGGHLGLDSNNKIVKASVSSSSGDIEGVTAGDGLSGGGTSGTVTLNVSALTLSEFNADVIVTSSESFIDDDVTLMTSAAINDRIESFGYGTGDITGVRLTADDTNIASATSGSADFTIAGGAGIDTTVSGTTVTITPNAASTSSRGVVELATTAEVTTGTDANRVVTPDTLKDGYQGSAEITTLGTISTGTWQGTAIASAYLDADTAHKSTQIQATYSSFAADDIDTKHYIAFNDGDSENTNSTNVDLPIIAPFDGKLLRVNLRCSRNITSHTMTIRLETQAGVNFSTGPSVVGTQSGAGPNTTTMTTYDFTSSLDSGDNLIDAGDAVYLSIQSDSSVASSKYYVTCLWEWDYSSL